MADTENDDNQSNDYEEDEEDAEDDEATLDEEDALNDEEDYDDELKELEAENEMSVEELRQKYNYGSENAADEKDTKSSKVEVPGPEIAAESPSTAVVNRRIGNLRGKIITALANTCESISQYFKTDDLEEDDSEDYMPPEIWKKEIRVGPDYQVTSIPAILPNSQRETKPEKDEETAEALWIAAPEQCPEYRVMEYLIECEQIRAGEKPSGQKRRAKALSHESDEVVPDNENALLALYQDGYDTKKAKSKAHGEYAANVPIPTANAPRLTQPAGPWRKWSEEDCLNFEKGMTENGKCFWKIQRDFLPDRMVGEIVCFYYSWKKTERYDLWRAEKSRKEQQQLEVKSTDLMGQIAESILQGQTENPNSVGGGEADTNGKEEPISSNISTSSSTGTSR